MQGYGGSRGVGSSQWKWVWSLEEGTSGTGQSRGYDIRVGTNRGPGAGEVAGSGHRVL